MIPSRCAWLSALAAHCGALACDVAFLSVISLFADSVRSDLGCHIDGFIAVGGHTAVVGATAGEAVPVTGRHADVIQATYLAAEAAIRTIKPGNTVRYHDYDALFIILPVCTFVDAFVPVEAPVNVLSSGPVVEVAAVVAFPRLQNTQVTAVINQVAEAFGVVPVLGTFSHQMKQCVQLSQFSFVNSDLFHPS